MLANLAIGDRIVRKDDGGVVQKAIQEIPVNEFNTDHLCRDHRDHIDPYLHGWLWRENRWRAEP